MARTLSLLLPLLIVGCGDKDETGLDPAYGFEGDDAGECSDGADNDRDGLFDCDDPGCAGSPDCESDTDTDTDTDSDTDTDADSDADADTDADADSDADSDADTDPGPLTVADLGAGDLVISEVMINPCEVEWLMGQWVEVYNATGQDVELDGLGFQGDRGMGFTVGTSLELPSDGYVVFGYSADTRLNGGAPVDFEWGGRFWFEEERARIELLSGATVIDAVRLERIYDWYECAGYSLDPTALDAVSNDDSASWCLGSSSYGPYGNIGTPGADNDGCPADSDGDGYTTIDDCDDGDATVYPGAPDTWYDGVDSDCAGDSDYDQDGDGYDSDAYGGTDCDDTTRRVRPDALDVPGDGVDGDCDGVDATGDTMLDIDDLVLGDLVISEVMFWPAYASEEAAWFEVYNASGEQVYLDGLTLSNDYTSATVWDALLVAADDYVVFGGIEDPALNGGVPVDHEVSDFFYGEVLMSLAVASDTVVVDDVSFSHEVIEVWGASVSLDPDQLNGLANDDMANWCESYTAYGWGDLGTPGADNACPPDEDGDGYTVLNDCDDTDATVHPGAADTWYDGVDSDCAGDSDYDQDGDGFDSDGYGGSDCDDTSRRIRPTALDVPGDGVDGDCDGADATGSTLLDIDDLNAGDLVITEFLVASSWAGEEVQWFEVYNTLGDDVYLDGLHLDLGEDSTTVWDTLVIPAGGYGVFAPSDDAHLMAGVPVDHAYGWYWIGWDDGVIGLSTDSATIDTVVWDRSFPVAVGISTTLDPLLLDATSNDSAASWCDGKTGYGRGDLGTPGGANDAC
jgi:hypothetical protein